jgi:hypothetical protein
MSERYLTFGQNQNCDGDLYQGFIFAFTHRFTFSVVVTDHHSCVGALKGFISFTYTLLLLVETLDELAEDAGCI